MTQDTPAFFTLDRGTVSLNAALIAPVDGRYRMLAAASGPVGIEADSLLEDLAWRVARTDAWVAGPLEDWREWSRLEVATTRVPTAVLVAAGEETGERTARAFVAAGWHVAARFVGAEPDIVALGEACLDPRVDAIVVGGRNDVEEAEHEAAHRLWPRAGALARFRDDVALIACGPFAERPPGIAEERLFSLPQPEAVPATAGSNLRLAAQQVGRHIVEGGRPGPTDSRVALRTAIISLASVLSARVEGIEIGAAAGSRTRADADGETGHMLLAAAGMLPPRLLDEDEVGEAVLRWSSLPGDPGTQLDALRQMALYPWTGIDGEGVHLRLAALRAALERMEEAWAVAEQASAGPGVMVLSGGVFAALPPAASALAMVDGVRRAGAMSILHDHAGVLAPLGALPIEDDRRRLLADLMDDMLLPLGSALLTGALDAHASGEDEAATLHIDSSLGPLRVRLEPEGLQLVDLPPGIGARLEIDPGGGAILGVRGRRLSLEVRGGLAGLLVDTRAIPLQLPPAGEARRSTLAAWEEPAWATSER